MFNLNESSGLEKKLADEENCWTIKTMSEEYRFLLTTLLTCTQLLPSVTENNCLNNFVETVEHHSSQTGVEICSLGINQVFFVFFKLRPFITCWNEYCRFKTNIFRLLRKFSNGNVDYASKKLHICKIHQAMHIITRKSIP